VVLHTEKLYTSQKAIRFQTKYRIKKGSRQKSRELLPGMAAGMAAQSTQANVNMSRLLRDYLRDRLRFAASTSISTSFDAASIQLSRLKGCNFEKVVLKFEKVVLKGCNFEKVVRPKATFFKLSAENGRDGSVFIDSTYLAPIYTGLIGIDFDWLQFDQIA
jgi:uncharacterized protein YjbI with pentapeptide repeats